MDLIHQPLQVSPLQRRRSQQLLSTWIPAESTEFHGGVAVFWTSLSPRFPSMDFIFILAVDLMYSRWQMARLTAVVSCLQSVNLKKNTNLICTNPLAMVCMIFVAVHDNGVATRDCSSKQGNWVN